MRSFFGALLFVPLLLGSVHAEGEKKDLSEMSPEEVRAHAKQLEEEGKLDEAVTACAGLFVTFQSAVEPRSMELWMRLLWKRNKPARDEVMADRRAAYEGGRRYIGQTGRFVEQMSEDDHRVWMRVKNLVDAYEADLNQKGMLREKGVLEGPQ